MLYFSLSDRIFCGEPVSTSPENVLARIGHVSDIALTKLVAAAATAIAYRRA
jgi:hypothetical protein